MRHYQELLKKALHQNGWQLDERDHPDPWWVAEQWTVSSVRERHGLRLFCTFVVDPHSNSARNLSDVRTIAFTPTPPNDWMQAEDAPIVIFPAQRTFPADLNEAMERLHALRTDASNVA